MLKVSHLCGTCLVRSPGAQLWRTPAPATTQPAPFDPLSRACLKPTTPKFIIIIIIIIFSSFFILLLFFFLPKSDHGPNARPQSETRTTAPRKKSTAAAETAAVALASMQIERADASDISAVDAADMDVARRFLAEESVRTASRSQKSHFLKAKGLREEQIEVLLGESEKVRLSGWGSGRG